ncbi:MAG: glycosyltransferase family 4 protein [Hyphomicrobiales bacterium]|nr:glycosyltransferase family 4 protein [Hyphomicrobiales bacterium]
MVSPNVAFLYWGRRGFSRFSLEAVRAARAIGLNAYVSVSEENDLYREFRELGDIVFPIATFRTATGAIARLPRLFRLRRDLGDWMVDRDVNAVICLMPHLWTPLVSGSLRKRGIRYAVIVHDAKPHPGDPTGLVFRWLLRDARSADAIVTLSDYVRAEMIARNAAPAERIRTVPMPDVSFPAARAAGSAPLRRGADSRPLRVLHFGRMLRYKGLPIFVEAMEMLAARGIPVKVSVCGEGRIDSLLDPLQRMGARVINRWLTDAEIGALLASHDVVVLSHVEASQSGAIAAASGAGLPVVTTPVGGLAEQVSARGVGLVAAAVDATSIADCLETLTLRPERYNRILDNIANGKSFSMKTFVADLVAQVATER